MSTGRVWPAGKDVGEPWRIPPQDDPYFVGPPDSRFRVYDRGGSNEIWRVWLTSGKEERVGKALSGMAYMNDVSMDGGTILWLEVSGNSKLALIENLFE